MLKDKRFWFGFVIAYGLSIVLPPTRLMSLGGGKKSGG